MHMAEMQQKNGERDQRVQKALLWVGAVAAVSVVAALVVVRATVGRAKIDPAAERVQSLLDEANALLKQIEQQKGHIDPSSAPKS